MSHHRTNATGSNRRRKGFIPPHCPNPSCKYHIPQPGWKWVKYGHFTRPSDGKRFQCFRCTHCGRRFSTRTFQTSYWLKRRDLLRRVCAHAVEGAALRQIARVLGTTHSTVARHIARGGRHCLLFHTRLIRSHHVTEPLVFDGFESYELSHYFPFHLNILVGAKTRMIYNFTESPLRRKGRMTPGQKQRRSQIERQLGRPDPRAILKGVLKLIGPMARKVANGILALRSDEHPHYGRAIAILRKKLAAPLQIQHTTISSTLPRTARNPLFPVNLTDLLMRHSCANFHRKTIAFSKRRQAAIERHALFTVWRNTIRPRVEKRSRKTPAMCAGILERPLTWADILRTRLFPAHQPLTKEWLRYYRAEVATPALGPRQRHHRLKYAV